MEDNFTSAVKSGRMTLNLPKLIKTLGESLYSDPTIAIRELIQNGNDSCVHRESQDPQHHRSAIQVRFDPHQRLLTVQDNGSGMTAVPHGCGHDDAAAAAILQTLEPRTAPLATTVATIVVPTNDVGLRGHGWPVVADASRGVPRLVTPLRL